MEGQAHMKAPSWLVMTIAPSQPGDADNQARVRVHIRRWHPGWWLFVMRGYWQVWRKAIEQAAPHG